MSEDLAINVVCTIHAWVFAGILLYFAYRTHLYLLADPANKHDINCLAYGLSIVFGIVSMILGVAGYLICVIDVVKGFYHG